MRKDQNIEYAAEASDGYTKVQIYELDRNPDKYVGQKVAIQCEAYCTNAFGRDYVQQYYNGNIYTISITRDYVAYDIYGNNVGYLITGDTCMVLGVIKKGTYGDLIINTEEVIIY